MGLFGPSSRAKTEGKVLHPRKEELRHFTKMLLDNPINPIIKRSSFCLRQFCPIVPRISSLVLGLKKEKLVVTSVDLVVAECRLNHWDWDFYKLNTNFETTKWCSDDATQKKTELPVPGVDFH